MQSAVQEKIIFKILKSIWVTSSVPDLEWLVVLNIKNILSMNRGTKKKWAHREPQKLKITFIISYV